MRILFLSPVSPWPVFSGGRQRLYHLLKGLAQHHEITLVSFFDGEAARSGLLALGDALGIHIEMTPFIGKRQLLFHRHGMAVALNQVRARRQGLPADVAAWRQPAMDRLLQRVLSAQPYDILQIEAPFLASYAHAHHARATLLSAYDIPSVALARRAMLLPPGRKRAGLQTQAQRWRRYEARIFPRFQAIIAMSESDAAFIRRQVPNARAEVVPNGVSSRAFSPAPPREEVHRLLFVGSPGHAPNLDAACWLMTAIWPRLRRRHPHLRLMLVNLDHPRVKKCRTSGVEMMGRLPDLQAAYRQADVALAPLRAGSGTRLKLLEAFAAGAPVVSTSIGYEGLEVTPGEHLLRADSAPAFADAVTQLVQSRALRQRLASQARKLVVARYDWRLSIAKLGMIYDALLEHPK
ncbi:MAG: hypothetical protein DSY55_01510 [Clostridia bacterium]|nr:MAG: hypothetical protein DSY55_01510 [Clostridia bacterium]